MVWHLMPFSIMKRNYYCKKQLYLGRKFLLTQLSWLIFLTLLLNSHISSVAQPPSTNSRLSSESEFIQGLKKGQVPQASTRTALFPEAFSKCPNRCHSLGDVAQTLNRVLRKTGYTQQAWYLTDNHLARTVVVLTEVEQIQDDGRPRIDGKRWSLSYSPPKLNSFRAVLERLIKGAPPGRYRSFIFGFSRPKEVSTNVGQEGFLTNVSPSWQSMSQSQDGQNERQENSSNQNQEVELERLSRIIRAGNRVPVISSLSSVPSAGYVCYVFVYEYEKSAADGSIRFINNSTLSAEQHLKGARIWQELGID